MIYIKEDYNKYGLIKKTIQVQNAISHFVDDVECYKKRAMERPSKYSHRFLENGFALINEEDDYVEVICRLAEKE